MKAPTIIGPVSIEHKPRRSYLGIRFVTPFEGMFAIVTKKLKVLRQWVKEHEPAGEGPFFLRYYHCDMKALMDVEVGFLTDSGPVEGPFLTAGLLPEGAYATLTYRGNGLRANQAMMQWASDNGKRFDPIDPGLAESYVCRYEAYLTDYRLESRKLLWDVELSLKLQDSGVIP